MAYVYKNPQLQALLEAEQELKHWTEQRQYANQRIAALEQKINTLRLFADGAEDSNDSLPLFCLRLLSIAPQAVYSVPLVRDGLKMFLGVEVTGANPLGILHTALGRLVQNGYAATVNTRPGAPVQYRITSAGKLFLQEQQ
jgi:hypothetical protein